LNAFYGGRPSSGEAGFDPEVGIKLTGLEMYAKTPLLSEQELEYYAAEFSRRGMHGPLNWYRTREVNWEDEYAHFFQFGQVKEPPRLEQEVLFVVANRDGALKREMAGRMVDTEEDGGGGGGGGKRGVLPRLRRREVQAGHWALWERPGEINEIVREWVEEVVFKGTAFGKGGKGSKL
jgi:pimeloyl-ACP methyl ester carboxylesterase